MTQNAMHMADVFAHEMPAPCMDGTFKDVGGAGRVYPAMLGGEHVWVKSILGMKYQAKRMVGGGLIGVFSRTAVFANLTHADPVQGLAQEAARLRAFAAQGYRVPRIVVQTPSYLVLSHVGCGAHEAAKQASAGSALDVGHSLARLLGRLHNDGLAHGDAIIKNFTVDAKGYGIIDLENAPEGAMSAPAAQARDIWAYLYSLARGYGGVHLQADGALKSVFAQYAATRDTVDMAAMRAPLDLLANTASGHVFSALKGRYMRQNLRRHAVVRGLINNGPGL